MPEQEIIDIAQTLKDSALRDTIVFGIGIHHAGQMRPIIQLVPTILIDTFIL